MTKKIISISTIENFSRLIAISLVMSIFIIGSNSNSTKPTYFKLIKQDKTTTSTNFYFPNFNK